MDNNQPTQPLLDGIDSEQDRSISTARNWKQMENWSLPDGSRKDTIVPVQRSGQIANEEPVKERHLERPIAILVLVGWGVWLLIYATFTWNMQRNVIHPDAWETYKRAAQTVGNAILLYA
jgi:hypothetical protein